MSLRNDPSLSSPPSIEDIETVLDFLSCPIIGCVTRERDYYYATGSLGDMTNMLDFLRSKTARA